MEININNEEEILKKCDFDYYYDSLCGRELCMFFNDIQNQNTNFNKRQAYIDLGRIAIMLNKLLEENIMLQERLSSEKKLLSNLVYIDIRSLFNSYASSLLDYCIFNKNADANYNLYNNFKRIIKDRLVKVLNLFDERMDFIFK